MSIIADLLAIVNGNPNKTLDDLIIEQTKPKTQSRSVRIEYVSPGDSGFFVKDVDIGTVNVENTILLNTTNFTTNFKYVTAISMKLISSTQVRIIVSLNEKNSSDFPFYASFSLISFGEVDE